MRVLISIEYRFRRTPDGAVWTETAYPYGFWCRYLEVFDAVEVFARVLDVPEMGSNWRRADGAGVTFAAIPHYVGPIEYLKHFRGIRAAARRVLQADQAVILRAPSIISTHLTSRLYRSGQPFGVEVVGDPWDTFAPGSVDHPLRPFLRHWIPRQLRRQCAHASAVAYVTKFALQARYPCRAFGVGVSDVQLPSEDILVEDNVLATYYSSIELSSSDCIGRPPVATAENRALRVVTVASLEQRYKGVDYLISAVAACLRAGLDLNLTVIGDGRCRLELQRHADALGLSQHVAFLGLLPAGEAIRAELDRSDIFVLASLTEGLPRAMVEAMARGLPCIGTRVGGIPELLPPEDMVPPADAPALAATILAVAMDGDRRARMSSRNRALATEYSDSVLRGHRLAFYRHLYHVMSEWRGGRKSGGRPLPAEEAVSCGSFTS